MMSNSLYCWQDTTIYLIQTQAWNQMERYPCDMDRMKSNQQRMDRWLFCSLLGTDPFDAEVERTLLRLFGEEIQEKGWLYHLATMTPSASAVEYFLSSEIGDLNRACDGYTLLEHVLFQMSYAHEDRLRLLHLLIEKGADINIPHETTGETLLFRCVDEVCDVWNSSLLLQDAEELHRIQLRQQEYAILANVLLEYGAEPLLENKHGVSSLYWLEYEDHADVASDLLAKMMTVA